MRQAIQAYDKEFGAHMVPVCGHEARPWLGLIYASLLVS